MNLKSRLNKLEAALPPTKPAPRIVQVVVKDRKQANLSRRLEAAMGGPILPFKLPAKLNGKPSLSFREFWNAVPLKVRKAALPSSKR